MTDQPITRCGFAAILGAPNAGKSTLLNRMTGAKLSIVTPKAQTTRTRILGIVMRQSTQILLVDTPGIFAPKSRLDRAMVEAAWGGSKDADLSLLIVDAKTGLTSQVRAIAEKLGQTHAEKPRGSLWLVLNKVDLVTPQILLPLTENLHRIAPFAETFMISAAQGDGIEDLLAQLAAALPTGPYLYPEDDLTDLPDRLLAAETVREQIFLQTRDEVPYGTTVETESFTIQKDGSIRIEAIIYVNRTGHRAILIGAGGSRIRDIGSRAREQLTTLLERKVHLFLHVKERAGWDGEAARLRAIGLDDSTL
ncbi:MAG: GTPase Era [Rhodospirillales bacterium 20-60-12]|jgi:GTP-binding protein Era|nr:MAG: GTPase Era [Rhodospirillales bacterium 20-60-12]HQT67628.1 GTPase Era [Acetobacteraceae bacterium]